MQNKVNIDELHSLYDHICTLLVISHPEFVELSNSFFGREYFTSDIIDLNNYSRKIVKEMSKGNFKNCTFDFFNKRSDFFNSYESYSNWMSVYGLFRCEDRKIQMEIDRKIELWLWIFSAIYAHVFYGDRLEIGLNTSYEFKEKACVFHEKIKQIELQVEKDSVLINNTHANDKFIAAATSEMMYILGMDSSPYLTLRLSIRDFYFRNLINLFILDIPDVIKEQLEIESTFILYR